MQEVGDDLHDLDLQEEIDLDLVKQDHIVLHLHEEIVHGHHDDHPLDHPKKEDGPLKNDNDHHQGDNVHPLLNDDHDLHENR